MRPCDLFAATALVALLAACGQPAGPPAATAPNDAMSAPPASPPRTAPEPASPAVAVLTAEGWGPLRIGMTRDAITAALGADANPNAVGGADPSQCDQYRPVRAPEGMLVMLEGGRLTRISLGGKSSVTTDRGIAVGADPAAVRSAYGAAIKSEPHKHEDPPAQYLTVWNKGDGADAGSRGIRYEVDATGRVARINAGGPSITYVEGCS